LRNNGSRGSSHDSSRNGNNSVPERLAESIAK
jgi:hypothetical protein